MFLTTLKKMTTSTDDYYTANVLWSGSDAAKTIRQITDNSEIVFTSLSDDQQRTFVVQAAVLAARG